MNHTEEILSQLTTEEKIRLCAGTTFWSFGGNERLDLPVIHTADGPHGLRKQEKDEGYGSAQKSFPSVCFPTASACACSFDPSLMEKLGTALASACHEQGVDLLLGPGINMKRDPLCGRNFEYYSEDPLLAGKLAAALIRGLQSQGIGASLKHFAGNSQEKARMVSDSRISAKALWDVYLPAFEIAVKEGNPWTVMAAYNLLNGTYCCENKWLLQDVLRKAWHYKGTVISDWGAVNGPAESFENGLDVEMPGGVTGDEAELLAAAENGSLSAQRLQEIAGHIIELTEKVVSGRKQTPAMDLRAQLALAREIEENSAVLLKNDGMLPLRKDRPITVIGDMAAKPRIQGGGSSKVQSVQTISPLEALKKAGFSVRYYPGYLSGEEERELHRTRSPQQKARLMSRRSRLHQRALDAAAKAEQVLFFGGLPDYMESEGYDRHHISLPKVQDHLIRSISHRCPRTAVVLSCGAPVRMPWIDRVNAVLLMYLGGSCMGAACASLLSGAVNPSGKLAETFPLQLSDTPAYPLFPDPGRTVTYHEEDRIGYRHYNSAEKEVLFPFGHGLSYTSFSYDGLTVDMADAVSDPAADALSRKNDVPATPGLSHLMTEAEKPSDHDVSEKCFRIRFSLRNTGSRPGKETAQLYLQAPEDPKLYLLKGFQKVSLDPGQAQLLTFTLQPEDLASFCTERNGYLAPAGSYHFQIGASSRDIRLQGTLRLTEEYFSALPIPAIDVKEPANHPHLTLNSTLRDLEQNRLLNLPLAAARTIAEKTAGGFIDSEHLWETILDSPFRSFAMGSNGKIGLRGIRRMVRALNGKKHPKE